MTDHRPVGVALENRLMSHGIYVVDVRRLSSEADTDREDGRDDDHGTAGGSGGIDEGVGGRDDLPDGVGFALEYETVSDSSGIDSEEVGAVVRTLLDIANEREWAPGRLEATSRSTEGDLRGRWRVEREWFDALGLEFDDLEFSQRVLATRRLDDAEEQRSH